MHIILYIIAAIFFFLAGVGANVIPTPIAWGLTALSVGLAAQAYGKGHPAYGRPTV